MCQTSSSKRSCMLNIFHDSQVRLHHFRILFLITKVAIYTCLPVFIITVCFFNTSDWPGASLLQRCYVKEPALLLMRDGPQTSTVIGACIAVVWKALIWSQRYCSLHSSMCLFAWRMLHHALSWCNVEMSNYVNGKDPCQGKYQQWFLFWITNLSITNGFSAKQCLIYLFIKSLIHHKLCYIS